MMKSRADFSFHRLTPTLTILIFLSFQQLMSQTKIMPVGNSITLGKHAGNDPVPPEYGYRDHLMDYLAEQNVQLVGPVGYPYFGHFYDQARIGQFLPDSLHAYNVVPQLNDHDPEIVLLHIGTNNVLGGQLIGNPNQSGTVMHQLNQLLRTILNYPSVNRVFVCKIIPKVPYDDFLGQNVQIVDYNTKVEQLVQTLVQDYPVPLGNPERISVVDMHAPFYLHQTDYYSPAVDKIHPNPKGYVEMARIYANHVIDYLYELGPRIVDNFNRTGALNNINGWRASASIQFHDVGESGGGAIYSNAAGGDWAQYAIWNSTRGMNTASMKFHTTSANVMDLLSGAGLLIAMDTTDVATATGYMVHVRRKNIHIYPVVNGVTDLNNRIASTSDDPLSDWDWDYAPGDVFSVTYIRDGNDHIFHVSLGANSERLVHTTTEAIGTKEKAYSGILFRGTTGTPPADAALIDWFEAKSKLIDVVLPAQISMQVTRRTNSSIELWWTAVGSDGNEPSTRAASYDLRYSTSPIDVNNFKDASIVAGVAAPQWQGSQESVVVNGLLSGVQYYFVIRATDHWGNSGDISSSVPGLTQSVGETTDNFDRDALGDKCVHDTNEYGIDTIKKEFKVKDGLNNKEWGKMALYNAITNPVSVKLAWGNSVTNPTSDADKENGGLVILADNNATNASGYFIFVRTRRQWIYIYDVVNGVITTQLDAVPYDLESLGRYPGANDSLAVVIDLTNAGYNRFNVYTYLVGSQPKWQPASRFSLFDNRAVALRHGNVQGQKYYAGLL
ncbi:MAG: GDSL-type esterase/lipase family protein, partial [bacterium]